MRVYALLFLADGQQDRKRMNYKPEKTLREKSRGRGIGECEGVKIVLRIECLIEAICAELLTARNKLLQDLDSLAVPTPFYVVSKNAVHRLNRNIKVKEAVVAAYVSPSVEGKVGLDEHLPRLV